MHSDIQLCLRRNIPISWRGQCLRLDVIGACDVNPISVFVMELSTRRLLRAYSDQRQFFTRPDASNPDIVDMSICAANCSGLVVPLNPELFYQVVAGNDVLEYCNTTRVSVEVFASGSPGMCPGLSQAMQHVQSAQSCLPALTEGCAFVHTSDQVMALLSHAGT